MGWDRALVKYNHGGLHLMCIEVSDDGTVDGFSAEVDEDLNVKGDKCVWSGTVNGDGVCFQQQSGNTYSSADPVEHEGGKEFDLTFTRASTGNTETVTFTILDEDTAASSWFKE